MSSSLLKIVRQGRPVKLAMTAGILGFGFADELYRTRQIPLLTMCEGPAKASYVPTVYTVRKPLVVMVNKERSFHAASWVADVEGLIPFERSASFQYIGATVDGKLHGHGKLTNWTGMTYEGEFEHGVIVKGTLTLGEGFTYEGPFDSNWMPHGAGKLRHKDGYFQGIFVHGAFPNTFKNCLHDDSLIMEVTAVPSSWKNERKYTIRRSVTFGIDFRLTGTYPCKWDSWEGDLVRSQGSEVASERGTFTRSFLTFSGKPTLVLNGRGTRWYRNGAIEIGTFEMGKLDRRLGDMFSILLRGLAEWVVRTMHGR